MKINCAFSCKSNSSSFEWFRTKTRFEIEENSNSGIGYWIQASYNSSWLYFGAVFNWVSQNLNKESVWPVTKKSTVNQSEFKAATLACNRCLVSAKEILTTNNFGLLTTASQSGGWVPETSRSFHYWQPAPRWRTLPWLANPGNPAMSPHAEGESRHPSHWKKKKTVERKGGTGEGRQPPRNSHAQENANAQKTLTKTPTKLLQRPMDQAHEESWHMRISNKPLTAKVKR